MTQPRQRLFSRLSPVIPPGFAFGGRARPLRLAGTEGATAPETLRYKGPPTRQRLEKDRTILPKEQASLTQGLAESLRSRDSRGAA
uniref:Uncharacterized protein n=1 Tax=Aquisalinus luteolus TaxID=1566827 RepID=A0A8J3A5A3_9PROT|nr:hypothetical protein GCM10011355_04110 [Aquisalinus luteolus]